MVRSHTTRPRPVRSHLHTSMALIAALLAVALTTPAHAQLNNTLPSEIVLAPRPSGEQVAAINAFVERFAEPALSPDFTDSRRAHEALEEPLTTPGLTVGFRQAYAQALLPLIDRLLASDDPAHKAAGVRLSGALATDAAVNHLIEVLNGDDEGLRLFAATRLGRALATLRNGYAPGPTQAGATRAIDALGEVVETGDKPVLVDAAIRSLAVATALDPITRAEVRDHALAVLGERAALRARSLPINTRDAQPELLVLLRACAVARDSVLDQSATASKEASRGAIALGAASIGLVTRRLEAGRIGTGAARGVDIELLRAGETILYYARGEYAQAAGTGESVARTDLAGTLEKGDERAFRTQARTLVGPASALIETYKFTPADRFLP